MSGIVIGVLGALAVAAVGVGLKWGRTAFEAIMQRFRPDHRALFGGRAWGLTANVSAHGPCAIRVLVACAPSRSLPGASIEPDLAIPFIGESFPGIFPDEPALSLPHEGIRFSVDPDGSSISGYAWAWASGRLDLAVDLVLDCGPDQRFTIPILEVLHLITLMAAAVSGRGYGHLYGKTRTRLPRKFDWFIAVSTNFLLPPASTVQWDDMSFPGRRPPRAGSSQVNFCPTGGYASAQLRSWKAGSPIAELLAVFLEDFLKQNGYHHVGDAVADIISSATGPGVTGAAVPDAQALYAPSGQQPDPEAEQNLTPAG